MREKKGSRVFAAAQQIGKALFLPIAVLPFAGILLGVGSSFTNETTIATYGLSGILHQGTALYGFMTMLANAGNAIFGNLALIFALAVALGMARREKGVAVMSSAIFYLVMLTTISTLLTLDGSIADGVVSPDVKEGAIASVLGIETLQLGVFGGVIAGLVTAVLCNKFYKIQLPTALSFFAGTRFVPIVSMACAILTGIALYFVWPVIQNAIYALGSVVQASGYFGTFIYGCIERALIPFGLHHIFYLPFWQTGVGGSVLIDGVTVMGAQNIFFAELASPNTTRFSVEACRFLTGKYPFMMGGLPGAALAMYVTARPEKKKEVGSLLFSVALTSFLTGITEPIEFTFLFLAPSLFAVHVIFAGLSFMTCHILEICIGTTFSDGLIDLILYGILPGQAKSNWLMLIPVIAVYFALYFVVFRFFILKLDLKTPGREADGEAAHLVSKEEYRRATGIGTASSANSGGTSAAIRKDGIGPANFDERSAMILRGVGGADNLIDIDCCATRLRLTLADGAKVDEALLKATGASGVIVKGTGVQVIYGPSVTIVKTNLEELAEQVRAGAISEELFMGGQEAVKESQADDTAGAADKNAMEKDTATGTGHENATGSGTAAEATHEAAAAPAKKDSVLGAHMNGRMLLINEVQDEAFASCALGDGIAVEPTEGKLFAPADGVVEAVFDTKHAVGMRTDDGVELLLHIGIDTVRLGGKYFEAHAENGQRVRKGDLLVSFDMEAIKNEGYRLTTPMIVCNTGDYTAVRPLASGDIKAGQDLLAVKG